MDDKKFIFEEDFEEDDYNNPECDVFTNNCVRSDEKDYKRKELKKKERNMLR